MQSNKIEQYTNEEMEAIFDEFVKSRAKNVKKMSIEHPIGDRSRKEGLEIEYIMNKYSFKFIYTDYSIGVIAKYKNDYLSVWDILEYDDVNQIFFLPELISMEKQYEVISEYINR